jgi:uncharacterized protein YndB with AHSA1/START domain
MSSIQALPAVRRAITVNAVPQRAFDVFTRSMGIWWPRSHHIGDSELADVVIEPQAGGRWYERNTDGSECDWGRVLASEPPHRLLLAWHLGPDWQFHPDPATASEVEVTFTPVDAGRTRVELTHRAIERHGAGADRLQQSVDDVNGWAAILDDYATAMAD